ncbi:hypothetical protein D1872_305540 [compost metagenome]
MHLVLLLQLCISQHSRNLFHIIVGIGWQLTSLPGKSRLAMMQLHQSQHDLIRMYLWQHQQQWSHSLCRSQRKDWPTSAHSR